MPDTPESILSSLNIKYPAEGANAENAAITLAQNLIRIPSLTPVDSHLLPNASASLEYLQQYLEKHGALCERLSFSGGHDKWGYEVDNLYAEWVLGNGSKNLCFIGHTDVVPPGDKTQWTHLPYLGEIHENWIYGRGATDMKGAVASFCVAVTEAIKKLDNQDARISLIITTDEEWAAVNGTKKVLEWLSQKNKLINAVIVGEPSSTDQFGSHIKVGRRGSLCGTLKVKGIQGHAAYKDLFDNPNRPLALAEAILNSYLWFHNIEHFPATNFEIIANQSGNFNATAIIPHEAQALWNIRYTTEYTVETLVATLQKLLNTPPSWAANHPDVSKLKNIEITANRDTASLPYYSPPGSLADIAIEAIWAKKQVRAILDATGGTTDGGMVHNFFPNAEIIELGLPEKGGLKENLTTSDYGKRGGMHQIDERCLINDITDLMWCYQEIICKFIEMDQ